MVRPSKKKVPKANNAIILAVIGILAISIIVYYNLGFNFDVEKFKSMGRNVVTSVSKIKTNSSTTDCLQFIVKHTRKCLMESLKKETIGSFWKSLNPAIDKCTHFLQKTSRFIKVENGGDYKFIILPNNVPESEISKQSCHLLTLGIGEDIEAERKVKAYFPNCTFVGADPIYKSGQIYQEIGHFLNVAVTDKNGTVTASVYENQNYLDKNVQSIDFYSILQYMNSSNIDFFFLDAEGAEYPIFPLLKRNLLKNHKICQISVEIHGFGAQYRMTVEKFRDQMFDLLENSNYLPIFGQLMFNDAFNRMFWVDYVSDYCIEKYFHDYCSYVLTD